MAHKPFTTTSLCCLIFVLVVLPSTLPSSAAAFRTGILTSRRSNMMYSLDVGHAFPSRKIVSLNAIKKSNDDTKVSNEDNEDDLDLSLEAFQKAKEKKQKEQQQQKVEDEVKFDGYAFRDIIYEKWGYCYDVDFNRVDSFGFRKLYLNILPFHLGGRRFRHKTELDYLCHLQAVVEILEEYDQLGYVLQQIKETSKRPIPNRTPLKAVPCRLDLTEEQVKRIIGY